MKTNLPDGNYRVPGKPGYHTKDAWPGLDRDETLDQDNNPRFYFVHVKNGVAGLTPTILTEQSVASRLQIEPGLFANDPSWQRYLQEFEKVFGVNVKQLVKTSLQKPKKERAMAKIEDGWYRLAGDKEHGKRSYVNYSDGVMTGSHHHYFVHVNGGKIEVLLPLGTVAPNVDHQYMESNWKSNRQNPKEYGQKYIDFCEKAWGCKIVDLIPGHSPEIAKDVAKTAAFTLGGIGLLGFIGRIVKNHRQAKQRQAQQQQQVQQPVQQQQVEKSENSR